MYAIFFIFKQKTSYEMRISDWSSDVCSSDLGVVREGLQQVELHAGQGNVAAVAVEQLVRVEVEREAPEACQVGGLRPIRFGFCRGPLRPPHHRLDTGQQLAQIGGLGQIVVGRSEEHTSEIQ